MAVRAGARKPDITTAAALKRTLLEASSIAYSASASGTYLSTELFQRLGVAEQMKGKARRIESERVGAVVARGEAEIGFQQVSELLPIPGIDYVGPLPPEVQQVSIVSAALVVGTRRAEAAGALLRFVASSAAVPAITKTGLEPIAQAQAAQRAPLTDDKHSGRRRRFREAPSRHDGGARAVPSAPADDVRVTSPRGERHLIPLHRAIDGPHQEDRAGGTLLHRRSVPAVRRHHTPGHADRVLAAANPRRSFRPFRRLACGASNRQAEMMAGQACLGIVRV
jgi:hypothetical protein